MSQLNSSSRQTGQALVMRATDFSDKTYRIHVHNTHSGKDLYWDGNIFYISDILECMVRPESIMLFKLPIMLLSISSKFTYYAQYYAPLIVRNYLFSVTPTCNYSNLLFI